MKLPISIFCLSSFIAIAVTASGQRPKSAMRSVDLKSPEGTILKASYFAAAKPGPGVLLFHQSNRTRESWDGVAQQLAAAGMNVLTVDSRGHGESGGKYDKRKTPEDVDAAFNYLVSQPGVNRDAIGAGGAGWLGVIGSVEAARRHPKEIKSLVLMSGETLRDGLQFLHQASQLPELFVFSDEDEYPPTQDAMKLLYVTASSPSKKLVHYSAAEDAPWLWYETSDAARVSAHGGHGTDMFNVHPELPQAQLWPEVAVDIIGEDCQRVGDIKSAIEIFKLNLLAYPDSADAHYNLADAYLKDGQKDLARKYAEKGLAMIDSHKAPLSSWSDTEQRRGEIRSSLEDVLKQLGDNVNKTN